MPQEVKRVKGIPDIVFCIDVTGSMADCIKNLKDNINAFITQLTTMKGAQAGVEVVVKDWRVRVFPFRDLFEDPPDKAMIEDFGFVSSVAEIESQLSDPRTQAAGGGEPPECLMDAMYRVAKKSAWRPADEAHRFVVVFTDAPARPQMHASTTNGGPVDLAELMQALKGQRIKPVLFALRSAETEAIIEGKPALKAASKLFESSAEAVAFFKSSMDFASLVTRLAATLTVSMQDVL